MEDYVFEEYPKWIDVEGEQLLVQDADEEKAWTKPAKIEPAKAEPETKAE